MTVRKLSVALEDEVAAAASALAARRGQSLSAWLNEAAARAIAIEDGLAGVGEWEAEHGPLTDDELAAADEILDSQRSRRRRPRQTA
ncbi:MAG TPA: hypothetical protein VM142_05975 [Acidimicrobiales bacterium]|nr:hypothetical protein [Acidimicrobiales bacterium]